jgi:hypothetical protein
LLVRRQRLAVVQHPSDARRSYAFTVDLQARVAALALVAGPDPAFAFIGPVDASPEVVLVLGRQLNGGADPSAADVA